MILTPLPRVNKNQRDYVSQRFNASSAGPNGTGGTFARMSLNANSMFRL